MFKSVIERQRAGRVGTGIWVSAAIHAGLFAAVLFISGRPQEVDEEPDKTPVLTLYRPPGPTIQKGTQHTVQPRQAAQPTVRPKAKKQVIPSQVRPMPMDPTPVEQDPPDAVASTDVDPNAPPGDGPIGHPDGDPLSTSPIGLPPGVVGLPEPTGEDVIPFPSGLRPPELLRQSIPLEYTEQARMARVEGTMLAKCVITREGQVRDCRILKGMAHMDEAVVESLESRRYTPVYFQGSPVSVSYVFTIRLKLPR
ncbi:TonB family protein [Myxococcus sp. K15C18031901]|uniref:energy transducer TonB n=1 Tax=Myxococcus dinghuensis TaxID=2906761 RepID=UPI0020A6F80A|nr:energy transducer TonB [Myxococcus dinghuensis]MCP3101851.1 TonB family protein [Myxococcus dinghuensis]